MIAQGKYRWGALPPGRAEDKNLPIVAITLRVMAPPHAEREVYSFPLAQRSVRVVDTFQTRPAMVLLEKCFTMFQDPCKRS